MATGEGLPQQRQTRSCEEAQFFPSRASSCGHVMVLTGQCAPFVTRVALHSQRGNLHQVPKTLLGGSSSTQQNRAITSQLIARAKT